jgi:hypothetical protein
LSEEHRKKLYEGSMRANAKRVITEDCKKKISITLKKYFAEFPQNGKNKLN